MTNCGRPELLHDNGTWPALAVQTKLQRVFIGGLRLEKQSLSTERKFDKFRVTIYKFLYQYIVLSLISLLREFLIF